jgi:hypothetical protein
MTALALDDAEMDAVKDIARMIAPHVRDAFLRELAQRLAGSESRDVRRTAEQVWRDIVRRRPEDVA